MPIIDATESLPSRPPIILYYGDPGICKTSLFNTSDNPLLIDFDRGAQRSILRKKVLVVNRWEDILDEEQAGTFAQFATIGIDTAKSCLDDFLMDYVCRNDAKLRKNKLHAYGAIGDDFKLFVNQRRNELVAIVIIAHSRKDEDKARYIPDITGQSYSLLMRVADQVGYISMKNNKRVITWEPTETTVGKNVARMPETVIPDMKDPAFRNFNQTIIDRVRESISALTEEQETAIRISDEFTDRLANCETPEQLDGILKDVNEQPEYIKLPVKIQINNVMKAKNWRFNTETKAFEAITDPNAPTPGEGAGTAGDDAATPLTREEDIARVRKELTECSDIDDVAILYHSNDELIESDEELKALFNSASTLLADPGDEEGEGVEATEPAAQEETAEEKTQEATATGTRGRPRKNATADAK